MLIWGIRIYLGFRLRYGIYGLLRSRVLEWENVELLIKIRFGIWIWTDLN